MSDPDRQKVYDAESFAFDDTLVSVIIGPDVAIKATKIIVRSEWWRTHVRYAVNAVPTRKDSRRSFYRFGETRYSPLAEWASVSHELAHACAPFDHHNSRFRGWHIVLVHGMFGADAAQSLRTAYTDAGLKIDDPDVPLPYFKEFKLFQPRALLQRFKEPV